MFFHFSPFLLQLPHLKISSSLKCTPVTASSWSPCLEACHLLLPTTLSKTHTDHATYLFQIFQSLPRTLEIESSSWLRALHTMWPLLPPPAIFLTTSSDNLSFPQLLTRAMLSLAASSSCKSFPPFAIHSRL